MYMYSGMADVAAETGDKSLFDACRRLWKNVTEKRMYVTAGVGAAYGGEKFTFDYDLPNESAYAETCAAIGLVFFAHRMLNIDPDGRYADVMERALYNGAISGISLDGKKFFYVNPLSVDRAASRHMGYTMERQEYFHCSCCPPNIARLLASLGSYMYSTCAKSVWVHLYGRSSFEARLGGQAVTISQRTDYPWKDTIRVRVDPERPAVFTLALRIPGWCRGARLSVHGKALKPGPILRRGYARIRRSWRKNDRVELVLPMPVERIEANPSVRQDCGRVALQRGPVVYCLEETDNGPRLDNLVLPAGSSLKVRSGPPELGGAPVITARALRRNEDGWGRSLYRASSSRMDRTGITAVPYALWANRKPGDMLVWIRECH
jgi:DUF1680 family protein